MMRLSLCVLALLPLVACGPNYSPNTYASSAVQQAARVEQAVVVGVRRVGVAAQGTTGAIAGAAAGGAVGSQVPASGGIASTLGAIGGSLLGGLVGSGVERATGQTVAYEYIVRKPSGELLSVTQHDETPLALGSRVLVIAGSQARIVPDYTVPAQPVAVPLQVPAVGTTHEPVPATKAADPPD